MLCDLDNIHLILVITILFKYTRGNFKRMSLLHPLNNWYGFHTSKITEKLNNRLLNKKIACFDIRCKQFLQNKLFVHNQKLLFQCLNAEVLQVNLMTSRMRLYSFGNHFGQSQRCIINTPCLKYLQLTRFLGKRIIFTLTVRCGHGC